MQATHTKEKPKKKEMTSSLKSSPDKKSQKDADRQNKDVNKKKAAEKKAEEEYAKKLSDVRVDYKDPYQLSEGEIMIVIEHSDDPGRVLMSTSHDYDKYKRISSKIRQWIMRDFPSMKVMIKPNNHQKDNKRIGCFEIGYFNMDSGQLERQDIFSKMVDRKWPKWKTVQEKIKKFVKNSNLEVKIHDGSKEKKNLFEGMVIHIKNVLFAKTSSSSGATTKSLMASDMQASKMSTTHSHAGAGDSSLTPFLNQTADSTGIIRFEHLPVGNYMIVFDGNRTYKPMKQPFKVEAQAPEIKETIEVQLEDEGFFSMEIDSSTLKDRKAEIDEKISNLGKADSVAAQDQKKKLEDEKNTLDTYEKKINLYKICLLPHDPKRKPDTPCIPISCEKGGIQGSSNSVYEAVIEPGSYDIVLINGSETSTLKSGTQLTRGENKFVLDATKNNEIIDDATHKKRLKDRENMKESSAYQSDKKTDQRPNPATNPATAYPTTNPATAHLATNPATAHSTTNPAGAHPATNPTTTHTTNPAGAHGVSGGTHTNTAGAHATATTGGRTGTTTGKNRPDTTSSLYSEPDESYNRLGSAEVKNRPGSASLNKAQEQYQAHIAPTPARVITEDPHENDDEKFMVKMFVEQGELPFEMQFIYEDEDEVVGIYSPHSGPSDHGSFTAEAKKSVFSVDDVRNREGYYRMIILRKVDVKAFQPVHVMINCNGSTILKKISRDPFKAGPEAENQCLDYAVFKFPDNAYMPIGVVSNEFVKSPRYMLSQIRSLISKLSESKLGIDKIFGRHLFYKGFGGKTEKHEGEECLNVKEVKKSLENFMIPISDHILGAFKLHPEKDLISLKKLTEIVESWRQNISVLDEVNDEQDEEDEDANGDEDYENFEDLELSGA